MIHVDEDNAQKLQTVRHLALYEEVNHHLIVITHSMDCVTSSIEFTFVQIYTYILWHSQTLQ